MDANSKTRHRKTKFIVATIVCVAIIAALIELRSPWIGFQLLRFRTTSSFVIVQVGGRETAFSLDEKQTRDLLDVIGRRTYAPLGRWSVKYNYDVVVLCKDDRSTCLRMIWVHASYRNESLDVIEELLRIAERGAPEDPKSHDDFCENISTIERVY